MRKQLDAIDDDELIRTQAIVQSMTPKERRDPKILNGSRRSRIAKGSGRTVTEVNNLVDRFSAAQKMMKQMRGGKIPGGMGLPPAMASGISGGISGGIPNLGSPANRVPPKKKSRSGNPAKRAIEEGR
jgi:signal recognition particle subunit SRP54